MVLSHHRTVALLLWLANAGLAIGACRATTLCDRGACDESIETSGGTGAATSGGGKDGSSTTAGAAAESGAAGKAAGGEGGEGGEGAAGGVDDSGGTSCPDGYGDCDGSEFTGCEANLSWHNRHCGVCGSRCEGACMGGSCLQALHIADLQPTHMVSSVTIGFVLTAGDALMKLDLEEGTLFELTGVPSLSELTLTSDRLYIYDPSHDEQSSSLYSMPLAGLELESESVQEIDSFGASLEGAYYVQRSYDSEAMDYAHRLWFRPRADVPWEVLLDGVGYIDIIASSAAGVVLRQYVDERSHLYLLDGRDVVDHGPEPEGFVEAIATSRGITVLTSDAEKYGLSWLTDDGAPKQYALSSSPVGGPSLHAFESEVAIAFSEQGVFFAQTFDEDGPLRGRIGLPNISNIALIDYGFLWHTHLINELTPRFMRSTWFPTKL